MLSFYNFVQGLLKKDFVLPIFLSPPNPKNLRDIKCFFHRDSSSFSFYKGLIALLFCTLLGLGLGACAGESKPSSPNNNKNGSEENEKENEKEREKREAEEEKEGKAEKKLPKDCNIKNGKGKRSWNPSLKDWNDKCELITCNGGFDDHDNNGTCEQTLAGHYSPAGSKDRTACTGKPDDASWTTAIGLVSVDECTWACDGGL